MNPRLHYLEIFSVLYMTQPLGRRAHRCLGMRTPTTHLPVPFLPTTHSTFLRHLLSHFKSVSGVSSVLPCFRWTPVPDLPVVLSLHISLLSSASEPHIMGVIDNQSVFVVVMHSLGTVPCFKFHRLGPVRCTRCATAHPPTKKTCANCMPWRNSTGPGLREPRKCKQECRSVSILRTQKQYSRREHGMLPSRLRRG
jgi:hypothetical protein